MNANNNFKLIGKEEEELFPHPPPETEKGVMGNIRTFQFMSNVLELYLPKVFEVFISLVGGIQEQDEASSLLKGDSQKDSNDSPFVDPKS
jgi:hypothetical protein